MSLRHTQSGTLTGLGIADAPGEFVTRKVEQVKLTWGGIEGDRHFGLTMKSGVRQKHLPRGTEIRNARQLSILSEEELEAVANAVGAPRMDYGWLGGNLCVRGVANLTQLPPSTRLVFPSGATIAIDMDNLPCANPGRVAAEHLGGDATFAARFVEAATNRRGLVGWVEREGVLKVGDAFGVWVR
jgi:MOSC domain